MALRNPALRLSHFSLGFLSELMVVGKREVERALVYQLHKTEEIGSSRMESVGALYIGIFVDGM